MTVWVDWINYVIENKTKNKRKLVSDFMSIYTQINETK